MNAKDSVVKTENKAKVSASFFCWKRSDLSRDLFSRYWRDVHAIWAARAPGFYQYRQFHLDNIDANLLSDVDGIDIDIPKEEQPNGLAHIFYSSIFIANLLRKPFALNQADEDDVLFVSRNTYQRAYLPSSRTFVDKIDNPHINGLIKQSRYLLGFKKSADVNQEDFMSYISNDLCGEWSKKEVVQRLRLELLKPHLDAPTSPKGVQHNWDQDKQYQSWIELLISEGTELSSLFKSAPNLQKNISTIHAYPIREVYTIVYGGKPTLVGLRGYPAAKVIEEIGADFQKSKEVLKFTYGSAVNGGKLLSPNFWFFDNFCKFTDCKQRLYT